MWIQPDMSQKLAVCFVKPFAFSAIDTGGSLKKKNNTQNNQTHFVIWQKDKLLQKHKNWCIQIRETGRATQEEYGDLEVIPLSHFSFPPLNIYILGIYSTHIVSTETVLYVYVCVYTHTYIHTV